jgi:oxalate decarboxylase
MASKFFFSLDAIKPQKNYPAGSLTSVTSNEAPGFVNISFAQLKLNKGGAEEPIWHPNASKIGYVIQGSAIVSLRGPDGLDNFTVTAGDVFFIPQGYVHYIANSNAKETQIIFGFNATKPEQMCLSKAIFSLSDDVFTSTFNTAPDFFAGIKKAKKEELIKTLPEIKGTSQFTSTRYKFNIAASSKPVNTKGGYLQLATKGNLKTLNGLGILGFGLNPNGAVEPHWHTNAGELVYIVKGHTRITVLAPDGSIEALDVKGGQGAFAPASHFHNILNVGNDTVEVIAFFNSAEPDYIGIGEVVGSYSNEMLGSIFNLAPSYFDNFKKPTGPEVIVPL